MKKMEKLYRRLNWTIWLIGLTALGGAFIAIKAFLDQDLFRGFAYGLMTILYAYGCWHWKSIKKALQEQDESSAISQKGDKK